MLWPAHYKVSLNLSEVLHNSKCKEDFKFCLEYEEVTDKLLIFKCLKFNKKIFKKGLVKRFPNIYKFCDWDINKFCLMLKIGVHPYEYIGS